MRKIHHAIDNIEFGVTDMLAIQAFYESAFEWRFVAEAASLDVGDIH